MCDPISVDRYFSYKVCINLDRRTDRWTAMQDKFARLNISTVERLAAVDANTVAVPQRFSHLRPADYACTTSHLRAVETARERGAENVLIFEDDAFFDPEFTTKFPVFVSQLPADWHMLFLGGYHLQRPVPVSANIVRAIEMLTSHAYAVRCSLYGEFIRLNREPPRIIDRNNTVLQQRFNCYCFEPNLVGQDAGYSDVMGEVMPAKPLTYPFPIPGQW
jgi:glycosyl transferase, family 25